MRSPFEAPTEELPIWGAGLAAPARRQQTRFDALVAAIRVHETATSNPQVPKRPGDHALYRELRSLEEPDG